MQVLVNEKPLEFKLENEIRLEQVLEHVQEWASQKNFYILDYEALGKENQSVGEKALSSEIETVSIQLGDQRDLIVENLEEVNRYIDKVGSYLAERVTLEQAVAEDKALEIREGLNWVGDSIKSIEKQLLVKKSEFKVLLNNISNLDIKNDTLEIIENLAQIKDRVFILIKNGRFSNLKPDEIAELTTEFKKQIPATVEKLEKVAEFLTAGKEGEAFQTLEGLIDYVSDGVAVMAQNQEKSETCDKLVALMKELMGALDNNDLVTAADIVDFDFKDLLQELAD